MNRRRECRHGGCIHHSLGGGRLFVTIFMCVTMFVTACSTFPSYSEPKSFEISSPTPDTVELLANGPSQGATPDLLLSQFFLACAAGTNDDFAAARLFLTGSAARKWDPTAKVQVYSTSSSPDIDFIDKDNIVTTTIPAVAIIDRSGILTSLSKPTKQTNKFHLVKDRGEWRITQLDDGIFISESSLVASYQHVNLYYPSVDGLALIGDPRWYPMRRLASRLLYELIAGPSQEISSAVVSAIPQGVTPSMASVDVINKKATVKMQGAVSPTQKGYAALTRQLDATLKQYSAVTSVAVTLDGIDLDMRSITKDPSYRLDVALAEQKGTLVKIDGSTQQQLIPENLWPVDAHWPAISPVDDSRYAWVQGNQVFATAHGTGSERSVSVQNPSRPSIDRCGWVWSVSRSTVGASIQVFKPDGAHVEIKSPLLPGSTIERIAISPDGARAAILKVSQGVRSVFLTSVTRNLDGTPTALAGSKELDRLGDGIGDVSWAGNGNLMVLQERDNDGQQLLTVPLGGLVSVTELPTKAIYLTAGSTPSVVYIESESGRAYMRSGLIWQDSPQDTRELHYAG